MNKSLEILGAGTDVVLDWGFWTPQFRAKVSMFYKQNGINTEWHYLDIEKSNWDRNIEKRNSDVLNNKTTDYYVDCGLLNKLERLFVAPTVDEIDVWVNL